ncbi:ABC-2 type transport system ATP-binding protein [Jatrophihabitans endophyticus]|uniref:ABC-2 type transport system ATP-binding protein n=1 Tax=Jatrophihabitans endophyticus TaxID=1206085 RepID=A0A1M5I2E4_9ACTN|nr:ABC transporter ATP-binding protein [Jatrophihabitans endophyticus]SHG22411.1 ABC-2 type transport system ATP-binding protein [Jatrophihabitans endophyticus]
MSELDIPPAAPGEPLISLRDVGIQFSRGRRRHRSIRELITKGSTGTRTDEFWPFRHVSFDIHRGEAIGVVGRNGQGKSTLLSLLAGVLIPDEGTVDVRAGVAPLIAITGGFAGDLTARENISLVAGLHGMSDEQIAESFDEIVDFAEMRDFLDTPYKHFSSGMKVRLAFSVVSRLREPIMLVDEVLAVGDAAFRKKCFTRIQWLLEEGQTLFLVSHSAGNLRRFCERGLYLEGGELRADGPIEDVIKQYQVDTDTYNDPDLNTEADDSDDVA